MILSEGEKLVFAALYADQVKHYTAEFDRLCELMQEPGVSAMGSYTAYTSRGGQPPFERTAPIFPPTVGHGDAGPDRVKWIHRQALYACWTLIVNARSVAQEVVTNEAPSTTSYDFYSQIFDLTP